MAPWCATWIPNGGRLAAQVEKKHLCESDCTSMKDCKRDAMKCSIEVNFNQCILHIINFLSFQRNEWCVKENKCKKSTSNTVFLIEPNENGLLNVILTNNDEWMKCQNM